MARVKRPTITVPDNTSAHRNGPPRKSPPHKKRLTKEERVKAREARQARKEQRAKEEEERKQYIAEKYGNGVYSEEIDNYKHSGRTNDDSSEMSDATSRSMSVNTEGQFYYHEFARRGELVSNNEPWLVHSHDDHPYQILRSYRREHDGTKITNGKERGEPGHFVRRPDGVLQPVLKCKLAYCRYCCSVDLQEENMDYIPHVGGNKRKKGRIWYPEHWADKRKRPLHPPYDPSNVSVGGELTEWSQDQDDEYRMKLRDIKRDARNGKISQWIRDVRSGSPEAQPPYVDLTEQDGNNGEGNAKEGHDTEHPQKAAEETDRAESPGQSHEGPLQKKVKKHGVRDGDGDVEMDDADATSGEQATEAAPDKDTSSDYQPNARLQNSMKNVNHTYQTRLAELR